MRTVYMAGDLSDIHKAAIENPALRQQALALQALRELGRLNPASIDTAIQAMDKPSARRTKRGLRRVVAMLVQGGAEEREQRPLEDEPASGEVDADDLQPDLQNDTDSAAEPSSGTFDFGDQQLDDEPGGRELSVLGSKERRWAEQFLGNGFDYDVPVRTIAEAIFVAVGSPKPRGTAAIDSIGRIEQRLMGKPINEIARNEGLREGSVYTWFSHLNKRPKTITRRNSPREDSSGENSDSKRSGQDDSSEERSDRPLDEEPVQVQLAHGFATVLGWTGVQERAFRGLLDIGAQPSLPPAKIEVVQSLRNSLVENFGTLENALVDLEPAEAFRVGRVLGFELSGDGQVTEKNIMQVGDMYHTIKNPHDRAEVVGYVQNGFRGLLRKLEMVQEPEKEPTGILQIGLDGGRPTAVEL